MARTNTKKHIKENKFDNELLREFIGEKHEKIINTKNNIFAFGFGLLFGPIWFFYRKMYLIGLLIVIISFSLNRLLELVNLGYIVLVLPIIYYFIATPLYLLYSKEKIKKIKIKYDNKDNRELKNIVKKKGGTSYMAILFYLQILVSIVSVLIKVKCC